MTTVELILCIVAVMASSVSQLCIKFASSRIRTFKGLFTLGMGGVLMLFSVLAAIWVLRTVQLSQLMPFAAGAYILVPLGSHLFFGDHLKPRFWLGVASIMIGLYLTDLAPL